MSRPPGSHVTGALRVWEPKCGRSGAAELAPLAGMQAGTGRTYIAEEFRRLTGLAADPRPAEEDDDRPAG